MPCALMADGAAMCGPVQCIEKHDGGGRRWTGGAGDDLFGMHAVDGWFWPGLFCLLWYIGVWL